MKLKLPQASKKNFPWSTQSTKCNLELLPQYAAWTSVLALGVQWTFIPYFPMLVINFWYWKIISDIQKSNSNRKNKILVLKFISDIRKKYDIKKWLPTSKTKISDIPYLPPPPHPHSRDYAHCGECFWQCESHSVLWQWWPIIYRFYENCCLLHHLISHPTEHSFIIVIHDNDNSNNDWMMVMIMLMIQDHHLADGLLFQFLFYYFRAQHFSMGWRAA